MKNVGKQYLKIEGDSIVFTGNYMEAYVPDSFLEATGNIKEGKSINTFGIFVCRVFDDEGGNQIGKDMIFKLPSKFYTQPYDSYVSKMSVRDEKPTKYVVFKYSTGDKVIVNRNLVKSYDNTEKFFDMRNYAKIPNSIPYRELSDILQENLNINSQNLNTPPLIYSLIIAESCRDPKNLARPFRLALNEGTSETSYVPVGFRDIARAGTFSGITFEDFDSMVESSVNKKRTGEEEPYSPLEKIIKM